MHDTKKHKCPEPECDFRFTRKENAKLHVLRAHKKEFNFKCSQCPKEYPVKSELNFHIKVVHTEKTLKCPECSKFFSLPKLLKKHLEVCHNADYKPAEAKFVCDKCDFKTAVKINLQDHIDVKHNGIKPCCTYCDFQTINPSLLRKHTKIIHKNGSKCNLICDECSHEGKNWKDFRAHLKSSHPEYFKEKVLVGNDEAIYNDPLKRNVKCTKCDKTFSFFQDMKKHVKAVHEGVKYNCDQCDFQSGYKNMLRNHVRKVHEHYRHKCSQCDKSFVSSNELRHHIQVIHEGLRFVCDICNCEYSRKRRLDSHMKSHLTAPFCPKCNKTFASEEYLKLHNKSQHTDSFPCPFCELETSQEADLRKHISDNHSVKKEANKKFIDKPKPILNNGPDNIKSQSDHNSSPESQKFKFKLGGAEVRYKPSSTSNMLIDDDDLIVWSG